MSEPGIFAIGPPQMAAIQDALVRARAHVIPIDVLERNAVDTPDVLKLSDRTPENDKLADQSEHVDLGAGYRLAISVEEQPPGLCLHLSLSNDLMPGAVMHPVLLQVCAHYCGVDEPALHGWLEEYLIGPRLGGVAVNGVWLLTPVGHA